MNRKERRADRNHRRTKGSGTLSQAADKIFFLALESHQTGDVKRAERLYRETLEVNPRHARSLQYLGIIAHQRGDNKAALEFFNRAVTLNDLDAECHYNAAVFFASLNRLDDAIAHNRRAIDLVPDYVAAHNNLAAALLHMGQIGDALFHYRRSLACQPRSPDAYFSLANALLISGDPENAISIIIRGLSVETTENLKILFVRCIGRLRQAPAVDGLRDVLIRAISETWSRPADFISIGAAVVKQNEVIKAAIDNGSDSALPELAGDSLFRALLTNAPIHDIELEALLTRVRRAMLYQAAETGGHNSEESISFVAAIAQQCFITEYVYAFEYEEIARARELKDAVAGAIRAGSDVPPFHLAVVAAYFPLHSIEGASRLIDRPWTGAIRQLINQQIAEPNQERELRLTIPALTVIEDRVSALVMDQYEQNPYPRWVKTELGQPIHIDEHLSRLFPHGAFRRLHKNPVDILIAGCGTGQHSIETGARYTGAKVLAIDLSLTSLSYAKRKTIEANLNNIEYAQADIVTINEIDRDFDVIETSGVLHHLNDPSLGLRNLLSILRPDGLMRLGLYSAHARKDVSAAREYIKRREYAHDPDAIRQCRQDIIAEAGDPLLNALIGRRDFSTLSGCRDLIFHAQEHQFTIPMIAELVSSNRVTFLGFESVNNMAVEEYLRRFPDDPSMTNLDNWNRLEIEYPAMFGSMYQFWIQQRSA